MYHDEDYCKKWDCPCHNDADYHAQVTATPEHTQSEADALADTINQFCDYTPYYVELKKVEAA